LGLLPEQIDPSAGSFIGNFPQAFSHIGVIASGVTLERAGVRGRSMRAVLVNPEHRTLTVADRPAPKLLRGTDVLLRTMEVGICGTDREICAFEYGAPPTGESAFVLGHEGVAEVV